MQEQRNKIFYQPFKVSADDWQVAEDCVRMAGDKTVYPVFIGVRTEKTADGEEVGTTNVAEDIYADILQGLFTQNDYKVKVRIGHEPNLVITYNGELVPHNDKIAGYIKKLCSVFGQVEKKDIVNMLTVGVLNDTVQERFTIESQQFVNKINDLCEGNFSSEFVTEAIKKYLLEELRSWDMPGTQELHYASYTEIVNTAGKVLQGRLEGFYDPDLEEVLLEELLYRLLSGNLVEKER